MIKKLINELQNIWIDKFEPKAISFLLRITNENFLHIALAAMVVLPLIVVTLLKKGEVKNFFDLSFFSTILIEAMLVGIVSSLHIKLLNHTEDPQKLTKDYSKLVEIYSSEDRFIWKRNTDGVDIIPVILEQWIYDKKLEIRDLPHFRYTLPSEIIVFYQDLFNAHLTSKIFNNTNIRVNNWYFDNNEKIFTIKTGRTTYFSSLVTNRAMDYPIRSGISVRELFECGPFVHPLNCSVLSNHLGFNGFVVSADNEVMFVLRKKNVSIGKRTYGNSIGASLKAEYALDKNYGFNLDGLKKGIELEIVDELGISIESLTLPDPEHHVEALGPIRLIAAYRDMLEGGKPQLLFYTRTTMSKEQINTAFKELPSYNRNTKKESDRISNKVEMETDGDHLKWLTLDDLKRTTVKADRIICNDNTLRMLPSATACVAMFIRYLERDPNNTLIPYSMRVCTQSTIERIRDANLCEDAIFSGNRFVAVIDGDTAKDDYLYNGKTSGRRAAEVLKDAFIRMDLKKEKDIPTETDVLKFLNNALKKEMDFQATIPESIDWLRASVIYFDRKKKIVVNYGNCNCQIGSETHYHLRKVDEELANERAQKLLPLYRQGTANSNLQYDDQTQGEILEKINTNRQFENQSGENGYPILNGQRINENLIKIYEVKEGEKVILCSDGYPEICSTFDQSEVKLAALLESDPLLIKDFKSTKGVEIGAQSFDDRTWVEIC